MSVNIKKTINTGVRVPVPVPTKDQQELFSLTSDHLTITAKPLIGEVTNKRLWAILKQFPTDDAEFHHASQQALFWYYQQTLGCTYNAAIQRRVEAIPMPETDP